MEYLGKTSDGAIVVNRHHSHLHEDVGPIINEALGQISTLNLDFILTSIDLGRTLGNSICVDTSDNDKIVYAQRVNRIGLTRFVLDREPIPSTKITIILKKVANNKYVLITSFIGEPAEHEPWDKHATERSAAFWNRKALLWGTEPILQNSITTDCPW